MPENEEQAPEYVRSPDVLELKVKDLFLMLAEESGTFADFSFRDSKSGDLIAFMAVSIFPTADKMREVFYSSVDILEESSRISFEAESGDSANE